MLLRTTDPFRDFDRLTGQLLGAGWGTTNRPAVMPMDAWRQGDEFVLEVTIKAERVAGNGDWQRLASERTHGQFSRQLVLGDNLDLERIDASYDNGVLRLVVPVAEKAKPRKIEIGGSAPAEGREAIEA